MKIAIVVVCLLGAVAAAETGLRGAADAISMDQADGSPGHDPASEKADSCASTCRRLRFVGRKQRDCVEKCLKKNDASESRSINHIDGGDDGGQAENDHPEIESEDTGATRCKLQCKRLRFVGRMQDECVENCLEKNDASESRSTINHIDGGDGGGQAEIDHPESESEDTPDILDGLDIFETATSRRLGPNGRTDDEVRCESYEETLEACCAVAWDDEICT